jgi:small nuclear ribonucleoprotein
MTVPLTVLEKSLGHRILLLLKDRRVLEGKLTGYDEHMNLVIEECEETTEEGKRRLGTVVLRGSNLVSLSRP